MSPTSNVHPVVRNVSYPDQRTFLTKEKRASASFHSLETYLDSIEQMEREKKQSNLFQRMKHRLMKFFQETPKNYRKHGSTDTFAFDPEFDLHEESLSHLSKLFFNTLRESKIKHLSCDHLYLPCNHIQNLARQCLIMSAEEPFGLQGAQIRIKLTFANGMSKYLPIIRINPRQRTIFDIEIDLHEDTKIFSLRRFLPAMKMFQSLKEKSPLYVSPQCTLVKNVFYKTAEPKRAYLET